ncbi:MAG: hypothetical protein KTR19_06760, partial [Hyphomicrobiales bacterium]|nr:hypothetical protein [Hyphomicrobiales bacterium]
MTYLLIQLFLYLICALVLGLLLGWVIWGARSSRLIAEAKSDGERALREQKERCSEDKAVLQTIIERQTAALEAARAETGRLEKLAALNVENVALAEPQTIPQPAPSGQVRPYHLSVVKSVDGAIVLSGIAPDEAERDKIHALASEIFGEGRFQSRIALADS